jgi:L-alanine-DL-glutamate epimerase-like enolase superfamily enzyme
MNRRRLLGAAAAAIATPRIARGQSRPTRPVRLVVPDAPGGGNDTTARVFAHHLEQALADLAAQRAGQPLHLFMGGALRDPVALHANINRGADPRSPARFAAAATRAVAAGFRAVKLAPFEPLVWEDGSSDANRARPMPRASPASPRCATRPARASTSWWTRIGASRPVAPLRFRHGAAPLPDAPGRGIRLGPGPHAPWHRMDTPWRDPRLG